MSLASARLAQTLHAMQHRCDLKHCRLNTVNYRKICNRSLATVSTHGQANRLIVYDHDANNAVFDVGLNVSCSCSDLSNDGRYVAIGYWERADIDVWNLETRQQMSVKTPSRVSRVHFDNTGDSLVYQSESGTYVTPRDGEAQMRISNADELLGSALRVRDNTMLVPLRRKGQVAVIGFSPVAIETVKLPIDSVIRCIRHSPKHQAVFVVDGTGCVYGYDDQLYQLAWRTPVEERPFTGAFCGDASLIGLHATQFAGPPRVLVLDATSGDRVASHPGRGCIGVPFSGDSVLQTGVHPGQILHLRDGSMEAGIAPLYVSNTRNHHDHQTSELNN